MKIGGYEEAVDVLQKHSLKLSKQLLGKVDPKLEKLVDGAECHQYTMKKNSAADQEWQKVFGMCTCIFQENLVIKLKNGHE